MRQIYIGTQKHGLRFKSSKKKRNSFSGFTASQAATPRGISSWTKQPEAKAKLKKHSLGKKSFSCLENLVSSLSARVKGQQGVKINRILVAL